MAKLIALLTDFGTRDHYVAAMKGVILAMDANINVVDITHEIEPHNTDQGAFTLWQACQTFPKGTVVAAVVDPGVGSRRRILAVRTVRHVFVAPDNGLLKFVLAFEKVKAVREVSNQVLFRKTVSTTFHGRDIFAPVAAHLTRKNSFTRVGPSTKPEVLLEVPAPVLRKDTIKADILYRDRFGNLISNLPAIALNKWRGRARVQATIRSRRLTGPFAHFAAMPKGTLGFVTGSTGMIEIGYNQGSAANKLRISAGHAFHITKKS